MKTYYWLNQNRLLSHLRTSFCALAIIGTALTLPSAKGDPPLPASGTYSPCFVQIGETQHAGPNVIKIYSVTAAAIGTFYGSLVDGTERDVIHPDGSVTFEGSATFVSAYSCGTLQFSYTGSGNINTHEESGHFVGTQGTGCLAGIYSTGTFHGYLGADIEGCDDAGNNISYNGQFLFAP